jgi:C-terminal processing protease CtpA/Prc
MMNGTTVDNMVIGGPAYNSRQISTGDVILKVNGSSATKENILDLLVGNDIPGSPVELRIAKGGIKASYDSIASSFLEFSEAGKRRARQKQCN